MYFALLADLLIGVLAVFGLYMMLRALLCARRMRVVLELPEGATADDVPVLLEQLREVCPLVSVRPVVLIGDAEQYRSPLSDALRAAGVEVYFVEF